MASSKKEIPEKEDEYTGAPGEVACDICTERKLKAKKSCLVCLASYCSTHLQNHSTTQRLKGHKLVQPVQNLDERACLQHGRPLELYSRTKERSICVLCMTEDEEEVVPIEEEWNRKKKYPSLQDLDNIKDCPEVELDTSLSFGTMKNTTPAKLESIQQELEKLTIETVDYSGKSQQVCPCGWTKLTTYQDLRTHQWKKGCTRNEESRQQDMLGKSGLKTNQKDSRLEVHDSIEAEAADYSGRSQQVCHCGWSKWTIYHVLRTQHVKKGCTTRGTGNQESQHQDMNDSRPDVNNLTMTETAADYSGKSRQVCHCGWTNWTTYRGLRTHQGKKGCTPRGTGNEERLDVNNSIEAGVFFSSCLCCVCVASLSLHDKSRLPPLPTVLLSNVQSIRNKLDELRVHAIYNRDFRETCLLAFTETWLRDTDLDEDLHISGFGAPVRKDRSRDITKKSKGGGVCFYINERYCNEVKVHETTICTPDLELLSVSLRPFDPPSEFPLLFFTVVYIHPEADVSSASQLIAEVTNELDLICPDAPKFILGDFNQCQLDRTLNTYEQYVTCATTKNNSKLDLCYGSVPGAYMSLPLPPFGASDHYSVLLLPVYKPKCKRQEQKVKSVKCWTEDSIASLQAFFECTNLDVFYKSCTD